MAIAAAVTRRLAMYAETVKQLQDQVAQERTRAEAAEAKLKACQVGTKK
jgi:hypothetical protein